MNRLSLAALSLTLAASPAFATGQGEQPRGGNWFMDLLRQGQVTGGHARGPQPEVYTIAVDISGSSPFITPARAPRPQAAPQGKGKQGKQQPRAEAPAVPGFDIGPYAAAVRREIEALPPFSKVKILALGSYAEMLNSDLSVKARAAGLNASEGENCPAQGSCAELAAKVESFIRSLPALGIRGQRSTSVAGTMLSIMQSGAAHQTIPVSALNPRTNRVDTMNAPVSGLRYMILTDGLETEEGMNFERLRECPGGALPMTGRSPAAPILPAGKCKGFQMLGVKAANSDCTQAVKAFWTNWAKAAGCPNALALERPN